MMKLTQTTLFQCFDKSQRQSPIILDDKDPGKMFFKRIIISIKHLLLDIIECELEIKAVSTPVECSSHPTDFLLPIHIRQGEKCLENEIIPRLKEWKFNESDDDVSSNYLQNFYRICPTADPQTIHPSKLQVNPSKFLTSYP